MTIGIENGDYPGPETHLTTNDVIGHFLKYKELRDIEERIERNEERLEMSK